MNRHRFRRLLAAALLVAASPQALAHGGEEHAAPDASGAARRAAPAAPEASPVAALPLVDAAAAQRLADGSLFVPKPMQYRLGLRTRMPMRETLAAAVALSGKVVADVRTGGRLQAAQSGRLAPGPDGLPWPGQRVTKGQVLAWLEPSLTSLERAAQQAELAGLDAQLAVAAAKNARYAQLEGVVPRKDIDAAGIEVRSLRARRSALAAALGARVPLRAPASGVVSAASMVAGQVVEPRDVLAEIVDPAQLSIEALAYDPALAGAIAGAGAQAQGRQLELEYVGADPQLRGQALALLFRVRTREVPLAIGQPLKVIVRTAPSVEAVALPRQAVVRDRSGRDVVWVHTAAEHFEPREVEFEALDADTVAVTSGLPGGERVVVSGAGLLAQVR